MGKGSGSTEVKDYLMSIHFAICKGPIDTINQVYVKELPIWCGALEEDGVVYVHNPELFGGDAAEGGVSGAIECYFGKADQVMNETVATRYGLTSATMPGYRGITNMLFRGYHDEEIPLKPDVNPDSSGSALEYIFVTIPSLIGDLFVTDGIAASGGFRWITNNPYLPGTWVNATRIPTTLSESFTKIYKGEPDYVERIPFSPPAMRSTTEYTIEALGLSEADVLTGAVGMTGRFLLTLTGTGLGSGTEMSGTGGIQIKYYRDNTVTPGTPGVEITGTRLEDLGSVTAVRTYEVSGLIPPETRHVSVRIEALATISFFTTVVVSDVDFAVTKTIYGPSYCNVDGSLGVLPDANPAHMIYEALTDADWGMGASRTDIDLDSFNAAAATFFTEKFGLSILWTDQAEIEKYVSEILDHVQATLFIDPRSGLWTLTPFRDDYDVDSLLTLSPANCKASNRQRKALGETNNEVIITWTNPDNEQEETVTFHDLGNISAQGSTVPSTRNYYGIRNVELANVVGQRDIRSAAYPVFTADIVADRTMSALRPGSVVKFTWPEDGIVNMVLRVLKVDYGKPGDSSIKLQVSEDIFALEQTEYTSVQPPLWVNPDVPPTPMDYTEFVTAPLPILLRSGVTLEEISDDDYPLVPVGILSKRQSGGVDYADVLTPVVISTGATVDQVVGQIVPTPSNPTTIRFVDEVTSYAPSLEVSRFLGGIAAAPGMFLHFEGVDGDRSSEIVMLDILEDGIWKIARGMFDTVIRDWPIGTRVWSINDVERAVDPVVRTVGVATTYKLLPKSSGGKLRSSLAPALTFTPTDRPYAPFRPSNLTLTPVGGTPLAPHPTELANPSAEITTLARPNLWTYDDQMRSFNAYALPNGPLAAYAGSRYFGVTSDYASGTMQQLLSFPFTSYEKIDAGEMEMSVRFVTAGADSVTDPINFEVEFYDAADVLISTYVSPNVYGGFQKWKPGYLLWTAPPLARSYVFRVRFTRTSGENVSTLLDDIRLSLSAGEFPALGFTGTEVPTSITLNWSNRNRLTEDVVAMRWAEATVTPEAGQTTTVRVVDTFSGVVEDEITGITGTTYSLALGSLTNYRFYRIEVLAERDGFESIQPAYREIQVVQLGYGNNYGFDYGENDGS